jgi:hypothetical protein
MLACLSCVGFGIAKKIAMDYCGQFDAHANGLIAFDGAEF